MKNIALWLVACALVVNLGSETVRAQTPATLGAPYVTVENESLLHSVQIFGAEPAPLLDQVDAAIKRLSGRLVRVNVVAVDNSVVEAVTKEIHSRYAQALPVITVATGKLSTPEAKLGIDVVIAFSGKPAEGKRVEDDPFGRILHPSSQVYISGQAERSSTGESAASGTMSHLRATLLSIDMSLDDIVQIRVFLTPIRVEKRTRSEIEKIIENRKIPIVFVEWESTLPVEIELIASSPNKGTKPVEYLTPLGMGISPLYSRIAKVNVDKLIYIGGLYANTAGQLKADTEVKEAFANLQEILDKSGSDMEHLVKATYFCSSNDTSTQLNVLRPNYFNPASPPAASKAIVAGVGRPARFMTFDMIAVPK